ncbi:hypothetical protein PR202_ga22319 [Eleusine coracana subsp. coracana]|uniref:non-specific serine/threonine protein kinase n=1 Tax=Eleusine coracana subsp. coracana TaxID=191504 RepID=A0AAV5D3K9_ELECO|nr:hypothetical protein PR202_ga22319 [Eleusine coracana subsp. coracana]
MSCAESINRIDWNTKYSIIKGISQGLHFLHNEMDRTVVHMDLHAGNIFLDEYMVPKISGFSMSGILDQMQTRLNTVPGNKIITEDMSSRTADECGTQFIEKVRQKWTEDKIISIHPSLHDDCIQEIKKCIEIALECVHVDSNKRPSIKDIIDKFGENSLQ